MDGFYSATRAQSRRFLADYCAAAYTPTIFPANVW